MGENGVTQPSPFNDDETTSGGVLPPTAEHAGAFVLFLFDPSRVSTYPLPTPGKVTIGRSRDADVTLDYPSVSRFHARIYVERIRDEHFVIRIEDLGSSNGTRVNGRPVTPPERVLLELGQPIQFGSECIATVHPEPRRTDPGSASAAASAAVELGAVVLADPRMRELYQVAERMAASSINVLLLGETGVGKDVLARTIHQRSPRAGKPFVALNCGAIAPTLLESELFGHVKGAFTGADATKPGLLETADGGTIFLDEIGEMPLEMQVKLLRVLETRTIRPLGSVSSIAIDVRVVCATNRDLAAAADDGSFRKDLYYRLNGITLRIPPLRERQREIAILGRKFLQDAALAAGHGFSARFSAAALEAIERYEWPGNIRQLKNAVECGFVLAGGGEIRPEHLPFDRPVRSPPPQVPRSNPGALVAQTIPGAPVERPSTASQTWSESEMEGRDQLIARPTSEPTGVKLSEELSDIERRRILQALDACAGNQTRAAEMLGMSRKTLLARLDAYKIQRPRKGRRFT